MAALRRGVGIPFRSALADEMSGVGRIVFHGNLCMKFPDICTLVTRCGQDIRDTDGILPEGVVRTFGHTVGDHAVSLGIHPRQEHSPVRTRERAGRHRPAEDQGLPGESVQARGHDRIRLPVLGAFESRVIPESHGRIAELVRKYIQDIRLLHPGSAGCGEQRQSRQDERVFSHCSKIFSVRASAVGILR